MPSLRSVLVKLFPVIFGTIYHKTEQHSAKSKVTGTGGNSSGNWSRDIAGPQGPYIEMRAPGKAHRENERISDEEDSNPSLYNHAWKS